MSLQNSGLESVLAFQNNWSRPPLRYRLQTLDFAIFGALFSFTGTDNEICLCRDIPICVRIFKIVKIVPHFVRTLQYFGIHSF